MDGKDKRGEGLDAAEPRVSKARVENHRIGFSDEEQT